MEGKQKYEKPTIIGPIQCLRGTNGIRWKDDDDDRAAKESKEKPININIREEEWGGNIVNLNDDQVFELNLTGLAIVSLMREGAAVEEISGKVVSKFEGDPKEISADVSDFVSRVRSLLN